MNREKSLGYPIPIVIPENTRTSYIIQTSQVILVHLQVCVCVCVTAIRRHDFEKEQGGYIEGFEERTRKGK